MVSTATDRECAQAVNQDWGNLPLFKVVSRIKQTIADGKVREV